MTFTPEEIDKFIAIWKEEFHETVPLAEARQRANDLLELYAMLAEDLGKEDTNNHSPSAEG